MSIDLHDRQSPCGAVHIRNKSAVGERLAAGTISAMRYVVTSPKVAGRSQTVQVSTERADQRATGPVPAGLFDLPVVSFAAGIPPLYFLGVPEMTAAGTKHSNFETTTVERPAGNISAVWGGWEPALGVSVVQSGTQVKILTRAGDKYIRGLRYAWGDVPSNDSAVAQLNGQFLYDSAGLPATVFVAECTPQPRSTILMALNTTNLAQKLSKTRCNLLANGPLNPM